MPLNERGQKLRDKFRGQYGKKKGDSVFYAMENSGKLKGVLKAFKGAQADTKKGQAMSPGTGATGGTRGIGRNPSAATTGTGSANRTKLASDRKQLQYLIKPSTDPKNQAIAMAAGLVIPGAGFLYKKAIDANTIFAPKRKTKTIKPPLNNNDRPSTTVQPTTPTKPIDPLLIKPKENFFNFRAYNSGGVSSDPPPKRGPNPQVPPVKMKDGKMSKKYKMSCPHRPDGIRGVGASIKGHKFIGVK